MTISSAGPARVALCLAAIALVAVGCTFTDLHVARETRSETHAAKQPPSTLTVVGQNGDITVEPDVAVKNITVTAKLAAGGKTMEEAKTRLKAAKINVTESSSGEVSITATWPLPASSGDHVYFTIRLPQLKGFNGQTTNGGVTVTGAEGPVTIKTSNDDVNVFGCKQAANITSSNGDIQVQDHVGDVTIVTSNGNVDLGNLMGGTSIQTSNGLVTINLNEKSSAPVQATTSNDNINLTCGPAWNGVIKAQTSNDSIHITGADGRITSQSISDSSGSLTVGSGGEVSRLITSNDGISITVN